MNAQEGLRQAIERQENQLRADVSADREAALLALLRGQDRLPVGHADALPDLVSGLRQANLGGSKALQLCLEVTGDGAAAPALPGAELDRWAAGFRQACGWLAEAELVLGHCETGFMRLADDGQGTFVAWIATKRPPTSWRERADIAWWAGWLARRHEPALHALGAERLETGRTGHAWYRRLADVHLATMAYQLGYPADAEVGGCTMRTYRDVLGRLIAWALQAREGGEAAAQSEAALVDALSSDLTIAPAVIRQAVAAFSLDRENAAYHAAVPGVAAAPLVRLGPDRIVWSLYGLLMEPFFYLTRELRRRDAQAYHNSAYPREAVFRQDLYTLFPEKRFVTSAGGVQLRRAGGDVRTDIDAVIFDRKTGTLGLFELKSQDPFARSTAELTRQRDNVLYANRQISGALDWLKRHGPDDLLGRVDARTAKAFRVQKVYPFVLGRYLVQFNDGPEPDRRAAWGTWPGVLRALDGASVANPLASLFTRLSKEEPLIHPPMDASPREIVLGGSRLTVYPSYTGVRASAAG